MMVMTNSFDHDFSSFSNYQFDLKFDEPLLMVEKSFEGLKNLDLMKCFDDDLGSRYQFFDGWYQIEDLLKEMMIENQIQIQLMMRWFWFSSSLKVGDSVIKID